MILYVLTFLACMSPDQCRTVQIPFDGTLMQCMLFGQHAAAEWENQNPNWHLQRGYKCESGRSA